MIRRSTSCQMYRVNSKYSETSTSSSSSSGSSDKPRKKFNRLLRSAVARRWGYFRRQRFGLKERDRSISDAGLCSIVDNSGIDDHYIDIPMVPPRLSLRAFDDTAACAVPSFFITSSGGVAAAPGLEELSDSDAERLRRHHLRVPTPAFPAQSTGNFATSAAGGGSGAARSAPATPLQLEPHPRKHDKHVVKPLSGSEPSVQVAALGSGGPDTADGKQPSKSRQKKFQRHFPQVGPEEKVLNYYSCALVGDLLLQGHLYITKNYFAFYSNVFGYVTKLLIPTTSVLRITKEKVARIIPNAVGVCTRDERHVFGSLLSRDSTYKLMLHVWKAARLPEAPKEQDLRVSEVELDASEYSPEDDSSSGAADRETPANPRRHSEAIIAAASAAVIQPALLTGNAVISRRTTDCWLIALTVAAFLLAASACMLAYTLYTMPADEELNNLSSSELYSEIVRWRAHLHTRAASELHSFLTTNLLLLTKVRQSLEALSGVILTDIDQNSNPKLDLPNETAFS